MQSGRLNMLRFCKSLTLGCVLTVLLPHSAQAVSFFELKDSCKTTSDNIYLADLVKNCTLPSEYAQIPLGLAPFKKNERVIDAAFIRESLIRQQKTAFLPIQRGSVTIVNQSAVLSSAEQEKMVRSAIDTLLAGENYQLEFKNSIKDQVYPVRAKIEIQLLDRERVRKSGNQLFQIDIKLNGRLFTKISINTFVRIYRKVLITTDKILPDELLSVTTMNLVEKEVTGFENELVADQAELSCYKSARLIPAGSILRKSFLKPVPVIKRGEVIELTASSEQVEVTLPATALFDCLKGDLVKFKINATAAVVLAKVTGPGKAELRR